MQLLESAKSDPDIILCSDSITINSNNLDDFIELLFESTSNFFKRFFLISLSFSKFFSPSDDSAQYKLFDSIPLYINNDRNGFIDKENVLTS